MAYGFDPNAQPDVIVNYLPRDEINTIRKGGVIRLPYIKPNIGPGGMCPDGVNPFPNCPDQAPGGNTVITGRYIPPNCRAEPGRLICREADGSITVNGVAKGVVSTTPTPQVAPQAAPQASNKWLYLALAGAAFYVLTKK